MKKVFLFSQITFLFLIFVIPFSCKPYHKCYLNKRINEEGRVKAYNVISRGDSSIFIKGFYNCQNFEYIVHIWSSDEYVRIERRCFVEENDTNKVELYELVHDTISPTLRKNFHLIKNYIPVKFFPFKDEEKMILKMCLSQNVFYSKNRISEAVLDLDKFIGFVQAGPAFPCSYKPRHRYPMQLVK